MPYAVERFLTFSACCALLLGALLPINAEADHLTNRCNRNTAPPAIDGGAKYADKKFEFASDADKISNDMYCFERVVFNFSSQILRVNWRDNWGDIITGRIDPKSPTYVYLEGANVVRRNSVLQYGLHGTEKSIRTGVYRSADEAPEVPIGRRLLKTTVGFTAVVSGKPTRIRVVFTSQPLKNKIIYNIRSESEGPLILSASGAPSALTKAHIGVKWQAISGLKDYKSIAKKSKFVVSEEKKGIRFSVPVEHGVRFKPSPISFTFPNSKDSIRVGSFIHAPA